MKGENTFMKKRTKKLLSLLLAIAMMLSLAPLSVFAADDPAPAELTEEVGTGTVIAVVYGKVMNDTLEGLLIGDSSTNPLFSSSLLFGDTGYAAGMKYAYDDVPEVELTLSNGNDEVALEKRSVKGSVFVKDTTEGKVLSSDLDGIGVSKTLLNLAKGDGLVTYVAEVPAGKYTLTVKAIDEPYGLANNDYLTQTIEVKAGETVIAGESKVLTGYMNEKTGPWYNQKTIKVDHTLDFTGFWLRKEVRGFTFKTTDVTGEAISDSEFVLINRDEIDAILKILISLGKDLFESSLQNISDLKFDEVVALHQGLIAQNDEGMVSINAEKAQEVIQAYLAFAMGIVEDANVKDKFITTAEDGSFKLNANIPAVLAATSDANGMVSFTEDNNITLTWMISIMNQLIDKVGDALNLDDSWKTILNTLTAIGSKPDPANFTNGEDDLLYKAAMLVYNTAYDAAYALLQRFGIVGEKMSNGHYLLFQYTVPEGYQRSPLLYTLDIEWETPTNVYVKVANLGLVGPYVAEDFYNFVRNTTFEGPVAKAFKVLSKGYEFGSDATLYNIEITENLRKALMTGSLNLTNDDNQALQGAFTAYIANATYQALGLDKVFNSRVALLNGLNNYLVGNQNTATNLMNYVNDQAKRAKAVYTGTVDEDWVFYTLDASPTTTATKLIDKSTKDIAAAFPDGSERQAGIQQNGKTVSTIVNKIGTRIEATNAKIVDSIKASIAKAFGDIGAKLKDGISKVVSGLFSNLFGGNKTANA